MTKVTTPNIGPMLFCGDPHGQFAHIVRTAEELKASAVILLGDMEAKRPLHEELDPIADRVWLIHGNHDNDVAENWHALWDSRLADRNVHGRVVELPNGVRLAGLGGVFREKVWHPHAGQGSQPKFHTPDDHARSVPSRNRWRGQQPLRHWSTIYPKEIDSLSMQRADILITHEAPSYHPNGFEILDDLARALGAKVTVHGHHHDALDSSSRWAAQGFKSFGVGLRGITAIDADGTATTIVQGERDIARMNRMEHGE